MNFIKEMFAAVGVNVEIHNIITDFRLADGSSAHQAHQILSNGVKCKDSDIIKQIRAAVPAAARICSIYEIYGDLTVEELQRLANSFELLKYKARPVYLYNELMNEYLQEIRTGNWN